MNTLPAETRRIHLALRIATLSEPADEQLGRLLAEYDQSIAGWELALQEIRDRAVPEEYLSGLDRWVPRLLEDEEVDRQLRNLTRNGHSVKLMLPFEPEWPTQLDDLGFTRPRVLFFDGDLSALQRPMIGIVGARASTTYGNQAAIHFTQRFVRAGIVVVSGGAYGIDGAAHREALASGGSTIAVLAGGLDRLYPAGHDELLRRIPAARGLLLSENAPGTSPTKWRFLARNRIIAALSLGTVVVEAGARSGSLNTAKHALELHRPLFAVPGPITSVASIGAHELIADGKAHLVASPERVIQMLAPALI